ncbi:MAG: hypothetical protein HUU20_24300 [Pirellulales bacterium]|nr:hypothetical protein [Pirellulales bacterium]
MDPISSRNRIGTKVACLFATVLLLGPANAVSADRLFHKPGLIYFWALNDPCSDETMEQMARAFAEGGVSAVCLHPRAGLLKPYGGEAWFEFIRRTVDRCAEKGLDVWLYDEDPFPSGNAGGRITMEYPEYRAMTIRRFEPARDAENQNLYCFPGGTLLWCGLVHEATREARDLTAQVGLVRRKWVELNPWDSRYYYPATPKVSCPRSWTREPEYAVEVPAIPDGFKLCAFVAQPTEAEHWDTDVDRLNPEATRQFLQRTHERYRAALGDRLGKQVQAIFLDEPKYGFGWPWTRDMFDSFRARYGYDLTPRLWQLFSRSDDSESMLTRLHVRQWCLDRFREAWMEPVSQWCRSHRLALVGHISPEDDLVQQSQCVSNLFPCFPYFTVPGFDLIIPRVGDRNHPLIHLGVLSAVSAAQQLDRPGVLSESLACSGLEFTVDEAARILRWQLMMGVTTHVIHCAYNSQEGLRRIEAPPDFGPRSSRWQGMVELGREMAGLQAWVRDATQIAPVAVLWPIRSFMAMPMETRAGENFTGDWPLRNETVELVRACLDRQVGIHLIDEADLWRADLADGRLRLGKAVYSHVVIPPCLVVHSQTVARLRDAAKMGVEVVQAGDPPRWQETERCLEPLAAAWPAAANRARAVAGLPRLLDLEDNGQDIRCTVWQSNGRTVKLLMNLNAQPVRARIGERELTLEPGRITVEAERKETNWGRSDR